MTVSMYRDFLLIAEEVTTNADGSVSTFAVQVFDSPVGQGEQKESVTVPDDLRQRVRFLENRDLDQDVESQIDLGEILSGLLLPPYARQMFSASLSRLRDGQGLRLRLRLADELTDFPWEYMYIQDTRGERTPSSFLALDPRISIVRDQAMAVPLDGFAAPSSRCVLMAMASPEPHERYRKLAYLSPEQQALKAALGQGTGLEVTYLPDYSTGQVDGMPGATLEGVMEALLRHQHTDVFHFSGHGEFTKRQGPALGSTLGEGGIILADAQNQAVPLAADRLGEVLRSQGIRLVVLGACETGRRDGYNVWSSVAASLLKARIPAVVAMQFTIFDSLAAAFSGAFYRGLVAGYPLDTAVAMGRAAIRAQAQGKLRDVRDWGVPVLYLRPGDGSVFNPVSDSQAQQAAERHLTQLFEQHVRTVPGTGRVIGSVTGAMQAGTVTVDQTITERVSGVVIGNYAVSFQGGRLTVRQKADIVDGTLIGGVIGTVGGSASPVVSQEQTIEKLQELLRMEFPGAPGSPKYCLHCGAELVASARFCARCGTQVGTP